MEEPTIEYLDVLTIEESDYTFEYYPKDDMLVITWQDEENDDYFDIVFEKGKWDLIESPIQDKIKLDKYLDLFQSYIKDAK